MGSVVKLRNQINNSYFQLKDSVEDKLMLTEEKIKTKLISDVELVQKMTDYHMKTGGKRLRALLTLGTAKLCGYTKGSRDVNLAACVYLASIGSQAARLRSPLWPTVMSFINDPRCPLNSGRNTLIY